VEYRRLGNSGLVVSVVGLGANNFGRRIDLDRSREVIHSALEAGITLIDTADIYGESETYIGQVLEGQRDDVVLATKFGLPISGRTGNGTDWGARGSRRYIRKAVESSLRRLRTDWIDLYQMHQPDPATPIDETLTALTGWRPTRNGPPAPAVTSGSSAPRTSTTGSTAGSSPGWFRR
jgi:aryl-alcohol dehydrogenase-like predicted oxidoreductase